MSSRVPKPEATDACVVLCGGTCEATKRKNKTR